MFNSSCFVLHQRLFYILKRFERQIRIENISLFFILEKSWKWWQTVHISNFELLILHDFINLPMIDIVLEYLSIKSSTAMNWNRVHWHSKFYEKKLITCFPSMWCASACQLRSKKQLVGIVEVSDLADGKLDNLAVQCTWFYACQIVQHTAIIAILLQCKRWQAYACL